jgi:hypothetical protein
MDNKLRCLVCGSSEWDPKGYKCGLCGAAMGMRSEKVHVSQNTKLTLLMHSDELSKFGINLVEHRSLEKAVGDVAGGVGLVISLTEAVRPGTVRDVVMFLRGLAVPEEEILRLRLDEPKNILTYIRMDKKQDS